MNFESDLFQYYIQSDPALAEHYEIIEILTEEQKHLILKRMSMDIASVFRQLGKDTKADLIRDCNSLRYIKQCLAHAEHKEFKVSYCKDRYCPICSHLKAHKQTQMLHTILESMQKDNNYKNSYLIFVTLTKKNVTVGELAKSVDDTTKALNKLLKNDPIFKSFKTKKKTNGATVINKPLCQGVIIKKECTAEYKTKRSRIEFNDHVHLLMMVRKDYWNRVSKQWTHKKLGKRWKELLNLDYTPVVWISLVKNGKLVSNKQKEYQDINPKEAKKQKNNLEHLDSSGALKEIGKYEAKESDMLPMSKDEEGNISINWADAKTILNELYIAYHRRRTLSYTGEFKKQKERLFGKNEAEDLIKDIDGDELIDLFRRNTCRKCGAPVEEQLQKYGGKTKNYYNLSKESLERYKEGQNNIINDLVKRAKNKKSDVSSQPTSDD